MSKAFTRESDDETELPTPRQPSPLPPGAKNYLTPAGDRHLRDELNRLIQKERPRIAASTEDADAKRRLQMLNQQIQHLQQILHSAVVVPPPAAPWEQVRFGATVTVRLGSGNQETYRIVGVDETDIDRGWVSWISPIAKALLRKRPGDAVRLATPGGVEEIEIIDVKYEPLD